MALRVNGEKTRNGLYFLFVCLLIALGLALANQATAAPAEIKIVSYNLLNLFDTKHDAGKLDYTYLPKGYPGKAAYCKTIENDYYKQLCFNTDWTEAMLAKKIGLLKGVIASLGSLPDILVVQEIENDNVAAQLAQALGYTSFKITHSPDKRGIDVACFYRTEKLEYLNHKEIVLQGPKFPPSFKEKPTRNILQIHFNIKGLNPRYVLGVYGNHWPSQAAPPVKRMHVAMALRREINRQTLLYGRAYYHVAALGDFNTLNRETPNAIHHILSDLRWPPALRDVQQDSFSRFSEIKAAMPPNSYWYRKNNQWENLDRIMMSRNFFDKKGIEVVAKSFRIVSPPFMRTDYVFNDQSSYFFGSLTRGVPFTFDQTSPNKAKQGFSDHFPIGVLVRVGR